MIEFANLVDITANSSATPIIFAYIDPGTGSILLQGLIAALIGGSFYFKKFIGKIFKSILNFFKKEKSWVSPVSSGKANGIPAQSLPPLFQPFRDQGYNTNMLGYYLPFASLLPGKVYYCYSQSYYKHFGESLPGLISNFFSELCWLLTLPVKTVCPEFFID
jgi:hypothetical protein